MILTGLLVRFFLAMNPDLVDVTIDEICAGCVKRLSRAVVTYWLGCRHYLEYLTVARHDQSLTLPASVGAAMATARPRKPLLLGHITFSVSIFLFLSIAVVVVSLSVTYQRE